MSVNPTLKNSDSGPRLFIFYKRSPEEHQAEDAKDFLAEAVQHAAHDVLADAKADEDDLRRLIIPRLATWYPDTGADGATSDNNTAQLRPACALTQTLIGHATLLKPSKPRIIVSCKEARDIEEEPSASKCAD